MWQRLDKANIYAVWEALEHRYKFQQSTITFQQFPSSTRPNQSWIPVGTNRSCWHTSQTLNSKGLTSRPLPHECGCTARSLRNSLSILEWGMVVHFPQFCSTMLPTGPWATRWWTIQESSLVHRSTSQIWSLRATQPCSVVPQPPCRQYSNESPMLLNWAVKLIQTKRKPSRPSQSQVVNGERIPIPRIRSITEQASERRIYC